jgi:hypothetical protein
MRNHEVGMDPKTVRIAYERLNKRIRFRWDPKHESVQAGNLYIDIQGNDGFLHHDAAGRSSYDFPPDPPKGQRRKDICINDVSYTFRLVSSDPTSRARPLGTCRVPSWREERKRLHQEIRRRKREGSSRFLKENFHLIGTPAMLLSLLAAVWVIYSYGIALILHRHG